MFKITDSMLWLTTQGSTLYSRTQNASFGTQAGQRCQGTSDLLLALETNQKKSYIDQVLIYKLDILMQTQVVSAPTSGRVELSWVGQFGPKTFRQVCSVSTLQHFYRSVPTFWHRCLSVLWTLRHCTWTNNRTHGISIGLPVNITACLWCNVWQCYR